MLKVVGCLRHRADLCVHTNKRGSVLRLTIGRDRAEKHADMYKQVLAMDIL